MADGAKYSAIDGNVEVGDTICNDSDTNTNDVEEEEGDGDQQRYNTNYTHDYMMHDTEREWEVEHYHRLSKCYTITKRNLVLPWISIALHLGDVLADLLLAWRYAFEHEWWFAALTLAFALIASVPITYYGATWRKILEGGWMCWLLLVPFWVFNLEPVVQYHINYQTAKHYLNPRNSESVKMFSYMRFVRDNNKAVNLKFTEVLLEAMPQMTLQLYIMLATLHSLEVDLTLCLQLVSLATSVANLAVTLFVWAKNAAMSQGWYISPPGLTMDCTGNLLPLACRILCIAASAVALHPGYIAAALVTHCAAITASMYMIATEKPALMKIALLGVQVTFLTWTDHPTVTNVVWLVEDALMLTVWAVISGQQKAAISVPLGCAAVALDILGRSAHILFYKYQNKFITNLT